MFVQGLTRAAAAVALAGVAVLAAAPPADAGAGVDRIKKAGVLVVGSDVTYPPFEYMEGNTPVGFDVDIARAIARELGVRLDYQNTAWDGIFAALKSGKFDMLLSGITITEERKKTFDLAFSKSYFDSGQGVAVKRGGKTVGGAGDLAGKVVGVQINTTGQYAAEKLAGIKEIRKYETLPEALTDLGVGRIDAVVADYPVLLYNAAQAKDRKYEVVEGLVIGEPEQLGIPVRAAEADLIPVINKVIDDLKKSGEYAKLTKKWFGTTKVSTTASAN
ncbi:MAG TPA: basic amino acid ABC transporter substrate-binding protein [Thermodesulfobacteriota bacterium]